MDFEQPIGDVNSVIRVEADQVGVERRMMDLGQRQAMRDHRLSEVLVCVDDDVGGIDQSRFGQMEDPAPSR